MIFDVLSNDGERSATTRSSKVTRRPKSRVEERRKKIWMEMLKLSGRYSLQRIDKFGNRDFRREIDKKMNMVMFTVELHKG